MTARSSPRRPVLVPQSYTTAGGRRLSGREAWADSPHENQAAPADRLTLTVEEVDATLGISRAGRYQAEVATDEKAGDRGACRRDQVPLLRMAHIHA